MRRIRIQPIISEFASLFHRNGFSLYIVGGAVRDHLRGCPNSDYDFTTDATPDEMCRIFRHVIPTGIGHGTVTVIYKGNHFEVTTFRTEEGYQDHRHPDAVTFVTNLSEDLSRRDFTINALAVDTADGTVIDEHHGIEDLSAGIIRAIGDPYERFGEDSLRILRGYRFTAVLGFHFEESTRAAASALSDQVAGVSAERIREELNKMLSSARPSIGLLAMLSDGLLKVILPELADGDGIEQKGAHRLDICRHGILSCDGAPADNLTVRWAALLHDIGKVQAREIGDDGVPTFYLHERYSAELADTLLRRLKFSNSERERIVHLIGAHMFGYTPEWGDAAVRRFVAKTGVEYLEELFLLRAADSYGTAGLRTNDPLLLEFRDRIESVLEADAAFTVKDLAVSGRDLISAGIKPGPQLGYILEELLDTVLDDPSNNTKERLLVIAVRLYEKLTLSE